MLVCLDLKCYSYSTALILQVFPCLCPMMEELQVSHPGPSQWALPFPARPQKSPTLVPGHKAITSLLSGASLCVLFFFLFFVFFGSAWGMQKSPGQASNPCLSCNQSHSSNNARSLTSRPQGTPGAPLWKLPFSCYLRLT